MGGAIGVESAPGAGSIFWVDLTLVRGAEAEAPVPAIDMLAIPEAGDWSATLGARLTLAASAPSARAAHLSKPYVAFVEEGSAIQPRAGADAAVEVAQAPSTGLPGRWTREHFVTSVTAQSSVEDLGRAARIAAALAVKRGSRTAGASQPAAPPANAAPSPWAAMAGVRVLVADDNPINRTIVSRMLEGAGLIAVQAADGEQALMLMTDGAADAALLDVNMPVMDGIEAAQFYNFSAPTARIPLIALTADASPETHERCLRAGMTACLVKPVRTAELLGAIADALPNLPRDIPPPPRLAELLPFRPTAVSATLDFATLADLQSLGGAAFVEQLVEEFREDGGAVLEQLEQAGVARDIKAFRTLAHSLCSIAANVGARSLRDLCVPWKDMSEAALNRDAAALVAAVRREWDVTQGELARHVADAPRSAHG